MSSGDARPVVSKASSCTEAPPPMRAVQATARARPARRGAARGAGRGRRRGGAMGGGAARARRESGAPAARGGGLRHAGAPHTLRVDLLACFVCLFVIISCLCRARAPHPPLWRPIVDCPHNIVKRTERPSRAGVAAGGGGGRGAARGHRGAGRAREGGRARAEGAAGQPRLHRRAPARAREAGEEARGRGARARQGGGQRGAAAQRHRGAAGVARHRARRAPPPSALAAAFCSREQGDTLDTSATFCAI